MATKSIVPRADNEGGIGEDTTPKYWKEGYFYDLYLKGLSIAKTTTESPVFPASGALSLIEYIVNPVADAMIVPSLFYGIDMNVSSLEANAQDIYGMQGLNASVVHYGSGEITVLDGIIGSTNVRVGAGDFTLLKGGWFSSSASSGTGNVYGVQADFSLWGGNIGTARAARVRAQVGCNDIVGETVDCNRSEGVYINTTTYGTAALACTIGTHVAGLMIDQSFGAFSTIPLAYGINLPTPTVTVQPTNYYGLYMGDHSGVGSVINWAIYVAGGDVSFGGNLTVSGSYQVGGVQVVSNRVIDARCDDVINSGDATTDGVIDALRDCLISHGLIAAA